MFVEQTASLEALAIKNRVLKITTGGETIIAQLRDYLGGFQKFVGEQIGAVERLTVSLLKNDYSGIGYKMTKVNFAGNAKTIYPKPTGMRVTYLEAIKILDDNADISISVIPAIEAGYKVVMRYLGDYEALLRPITLDTEVYDIDEAKKKIAKAFDFGDTSSNAPLSQLVQRSNDWMQVEEEFRKLMLKVGATEPEKVENKVAVMSDRMGVLLDRLKDLDTSNKVVSTNLGKLSELTYNLARMVELYTTYMYTCTLVQVALKRTKDHR